MATATIMTETVFGVDLIVHAETKNKALIVIREDGLGVSIPLTKAKAEELVEMGLTTGS